MEIAMVKKLIPLSFILVRRPAQPNGLHPLPTPSTGQIDMEQQAVYAFLLSICTNIEATSIMDTTATGVTGVENTTQTPITFYRICTVWTRNCG